MQSNNCSEFQLSEFIETIEEILSSGGEFTMFPKGVSMMPLIVQGRDSVTLKKKEAPLLKGDLAFYRRVSGQLVLHRVMSIETDGTYIMCGDNQTELERGIAQEQIIGYVCQICRKGKNLMPGSLWYSLYKFWWMKMPLRKAYMFLARVKGKIKRIITKRK